MCYLYLYIKENPQTSNFILSYLAEEDPWLLFKTPLPTFQDSPAHSGPPHLWEATIQLEIWPHISIKVNSVG